MVTQRNERNCPQLFRGINKFNVFPMDIKYVLGKREERTELPGA